MARGKTKKRRSARAAAGLGTAPGARVGAFLGGAGGRWLGVAALMVGGSALVAWGLMVGYRALEARAASHLEAERVTVRIAWPTQGGAPGAPMGAGEEAEGATWLSRFFRERLVSAAAASADEAGSAMSGAQLRAVSRVLLESGWFEGTPRVWREGGGVLRVEGRWRVPMAAVRHGGREYLVGADGRPMPVPAYAAGESRYAFIEGVGNGPPLNDGGGVDVFRVWAGSGVPAALALLGVLPSDAPWRNQVAGIDVSALEAGRGSDSGLVIRTTHGTRVVWGAAPGGFRPGETSTEGKLDRLNQFYARYGRIDAGAPRIEIFPQGPVVVEPERR